MLIPIPSKTTSIYDGINKLKVNFNLIHYNFELSDLNPQFFNNLMPKVTEMFDEINKKCNSFNELKAVRKLIYLLFFLPLISLVFTFVFVILGISHPHFKYVMYMGIGVSIIMIIVIILVLLFCIRGKTKSLNRKYEKIITVILKRYNEEFFEKNNILGKMERENKVTSYSRRGTLGTSKTFFVSFRRIKRCELPIFSEQGYQPPIIKD